MADDTIKFRAYHFPYLESGDYTLGASQTLSGAGIASVAGAPSVFNSGDFTFSVQGPRFQLLPSEIDSVFPPEGSLGEYSTVLPHIVLNRKTLPWERRLFSGSDGDLTDAQKRTSWLALLVFQAPELNYPNPAGAPDQDAQQLQLEAEDGLIRTLAQFQTDLGQTLVLETGQQLTDQASVIYVKKSVLETILPTADDLSYLAHIREGTTEKAVVFANRLPGQSPGAGNIVHLISLEHRFKPDNTMDYGSAGDDDLIPLVSLKSWRFACVRPRHTFHGLLLHLNQEEPAYLGEKPDNLSGTEVIGQAVSGFGNLAQYFLQANIDLSDQASFSDTGVKIQIANGARYIIGNSGIIYNQAGVALTGISLPADPPPVEQADTYWWITDEDEAYFLSLENEVLYAHRLGGANDQTLKIPLAENDQANQIIEQGFVPAPHFFREGSKSVSWYRGPFLPAPGPTTTGFEPDALLRAKSPDAFLRYFESLGMLDVSYAAAWELGRMLAINSKPFSIALDRLKRQRQRMALALAQLPGFHLPIPGLSTEADELTLETIRTWLQGLRELQYVPFNYLLPDERLLPPESLRFFYLDANWMDALAAGALSIGRGRQLDPNLSSWLSPQLQAIDTLGAYMRAPHVVTGCIMRSMVVSGWPGLQADGYDEQGAVLPMLAKKQLGPQIICCLFEGSLQSIDFHLRPEVLHFGFEREDDGLYKWPRTVHGTFGGDSIPLSPNLLGVNDVIDISGLKGAIQAISGLGFGPGFDAADFAVAMIAGVERVRFLRGPDRLEGQGRIYAIDEVDTEAFFPGTDGRDASAAALQSFIEENFEYPLSAYAVNPGVTGFTVKLVIEKDGSITGVELIQVEGSGLEASILASVNALAQEPPWTAAQRGGQAVRMELRFGADFRQAWKMETIQATEDVSPDYLGNTALALSADGTTVLIGVNEDSWGNGVPPSGNGKAYVFTKIAGTWNETLLQTDDDITDFGSSVALSRDGATALVGNGSGPVYAYQLQDGQVHNTQKIILSGPYIVDGIDLSGFGSSMALSKDGSIALIGADGMPGKESEQQGAAYIFSLENGLWNQTAFFQIQTGEPPSERFGYSSALSPEGSIVLISGTGGDYGWIVYLYYLRADNTWWGPLTFQKEPDINVFFGSSVALSDDGATVLIGAEWDGVDNEGKAYVYRLKQGSWQANTPLQPTVNDVSVNVFGRSVALSGDGAVAVIGANYSNGSGGKAFVFYLFDEAWIEITSFGISDDGEADYDWEAFVDISSDGRKVLIGSGPAGRAYLYTSSINITAFRYGNIEE